MGDLAKFDPMAGDEATILRSKKATALERIVGHLYDAGEMEVPTRVPYEYHGAYPWNTITTTGTGWARTVWTTNGAAWDTTPTTGGN